MKLRVLRRNIYVAKSQLGFGVKSIDVYKDILQMWDAEAGWIDVPVTHDNVRINANGFNGETY